MDELNRLGVSDQVEPCMPSFSTALERLYIFFSSECSVDDHFERSGKGDRHLHRQKPRHPAIPHGYPVIHGNRDSLVETTTLRDTDVKKRPTISPLIMLRPLHYLASSHYLPKAHKALHRALLAALPLRSGQYHGSLPGPL